MRIIYFLIDLPGLLPGLAGPLPGLAGPAPGFAVCRGFIDISVRLL